MKRNVKDLIGKWYLREFDLLPEQITESIAKKYTMLLQNGNPCFFYETKESALQASQKAQNAIGWIARKQYQAMTPEEKRAYSRAYSREYYRLHRDSILANKRRTGYNKAYYASLSDEKKEEYNRRRREKGYNYPCYQKQRMMYHTEEYRAKRREDYAKKHANDPMTPHREKMIAVMKEVVKTPIELRRAKKQFIKDSKLCHES